MSFKSNRRINSGSGNISLPSGWLQPKSARKLSTASGKYPALRNQDAQTGFFLFESLERSVLRRIGTWAKTGNFHPNALYRSTCLGVEEIHSSARMIWLISIV